jgi:maltooligosyltrehalose trehalohydrolase
MNHLHDMPFGATVLPEGGVRFRLWAPSTDYIDLMLAAPGEATPRSQRMTRVADGWHEWTAPEAAAGTRYQFVTPAGLAVPDPASRSNPDGVHAASEVVDPRRYAWQDDAWLGRPWHEAVIYELHVGTFTDEGTFVAAIERLPALAALGITAVELLPLSSFPGERGWGYDGVLPFAPQASCGSPDALKQFVDAAHALGMMVLMDVVYNHFGPEGNYLNAFSPEFFNPAHQTPWGAAINFDGPHHRTVRDFFVHNALYWIEEYRFDGLRMDAVHAIRDDSAQHISREIGEALRALGRRETPPRAVHLVLENDANKASLLARDDHGAPEGADAQWNDDLHHVAHVLATGEVDGYYADYADAPLKRLGGSLAEGFAYQGEASTLRAGEPRGEPSGHLPSVAFVSFLQNHDQIGNRAFGERIEALARKGAGGSARLEALYACLLLSPQVPMLFMGEEFAASTPFLYFCDFEPVLAAAVSQGRRDEFKRFAMFGDEAVRARIPDPNAASTFLACKLKWSEREAPAHAHWLGLISALIALRARHLVPRLAHPTLGGHAVVDAAVLQVEWVLGEGSVWHLALNLGTTDAALPARGETVFALRADRAGLQAEGVRVTVESTGDEAQAKAQAEAAAAIETAADTDADERADAVSQPAAGAVDPEPV